ncbi:tetratricopeptide repeat protein [Providencia sneebia]|uniref:Uncharacterized protein n=1 Tax=Providencia sneebia DSM 19967 TaxID=1141660 RepID=K8VYA7_9GAMM|nr:tetratricopeptide repeat protein [Providencia sneebia]EKT53144.1 hypothetical protein OO7_16163 [Providencia sneebia DSM 19967]
MNFRLLILLFCFCEASYALAQPIEAPSEINKEKPQSSAPATLQNNLPVEFQNRLKLAQAGDVAAMIDIGLAYAEGTDFLSVDDKQAYTWFKKASDLNNTDGDYYLGVLAQHQDNYEEAARWYRKGAESGDAYCQYALGYLYENGLGVEQNYKQAKAWYVESAEQGQASGQFALGMFYHDGIGGDVDYQKARMWYEKSAELGVAASLNNLAVMYEKGQGVREDGQKAADLYHQAANMGSSTAQANMGKFYHNGTEFLEQNDYQSIYWYKRAALQENEEAQYALAQGYETGKGIGQDVNMAFEWYQKAGSNGSAAAGMKVAEYYEKGIGDIPPNQQKAIDWYLSMAEANVREAQVRLAQLYIAGKLDNIDNNTLINWLTTAEKDNVQSKSQLGMFYLLGKGVKKDEQKARQLFLQSAFQNESDAQNNLAVMYARGMGGDKSIFRAVMWLERSDKLGNKIAANNLKLLQENKNTSPEMLQFTQNVQTTKEPVKTSKN